MGPSVTARPPLLRTSARPRSAAYVRLRMERAAWLTLKEAAQQLGVSEDTVRRRVFRRLLPARREETPQGYRWLVRLDGAPVAEDAEWKPADSAEAPTGPAPLVPFKGGGELSDFVNGLLLPWRERVEAQGAELERLQGALRLERDARQEAEARLRVLQEPAAEPAGTVVGPQRPWWKFWD